MCAACQFVKQCHRSTPGKKQSTVQDQVGSTKKEFHLPGQGVAVDHFYCSTKGRLFTSRGKEADKDMFCGGALFVDMATGMVSVHFQVHLNSHETLAAVNEFEASCRELGVVPQVYVTDNGSAFKSKEFKDHLGTFHQTVRFAGAGGHHQNGVAERKIRTVMNIARALMFHAAIYWPDEKISSGLVRIKIERKKMLPTVATI